MVWKKAILQDRNRNGLRGDPEENSGQETALSSRIVVPDPSGGIFLRNTRARNPVDGTVCNRER